MKPEDQHEMFTPPPGKFPRVRATFARVRALEFIIGWGPHEEKELARFIGCDPDIETLVAGGLIKREERVSIRHGGEMVKLCKATELGREWLRNLGGMNEPAEPD